MEKFFKSNRKFSIFLTVWVILQIVLLIFVTKVGDNLVFPFQTTDLHYYGFWEQVGYTFLIVVLYNSYTQKRSSVQDGELFRHANVEFVSDYMLSTRIIEVIKEAEKSLMLVSPYIRLSPPIKKELKLLQDVDLELYVLFGKNEGNISRSLTFEDLEVFKGFRNVHIGYVETLHAKFYANQDYLILCSMNLLEFSQNMNSECGFRIKPTSYFTDSENNIWNETLEYFRDLYLTGKILYKKTPTESVDNINLYYPMAAGGGMSSNAVSIKSGDSNIPKKAWNPWTLEEEAQLIALYRNDKTVDEISRTLARTPGGITARLVKLGIIDEG
jgi:hypothetical protein